MTRPYGMHPLAFESYIAACGQAKVQPARVMQTLGDAPASAGTHAGDGNYTEESGARARYCAAVDLRSKDLTKLQISQLLNRLFDNGFFGWWRHEGSFAHNQHLHVVFAGVGMKKALRSQFHDFCHDRDGLVHHEPFDGPTASNGQKNILRELFFKFNPANG